MIELIQACSPSMHLPVAQAIIKSESSFNQFAIGVNKGKAIRQPKSYQEAVTTAKWLLANGANIDMGYAQINSSNLRWLGMSVEQAFDPCSNLKAMQTIYLNCYAKAGETGYGNRMQRAFSCYNTGNVTGGFRNGYVNKVTNNFNTLVGGAKIKYQQYPQIQNQNQKNTVAITTNTGTANSNNPQKNFLVSVKTAVTTVEKTKEDSPQLNTVSQNNPNTAEQPVKVFLTWDVFKDF